MKLISIFKNLLLKEYNVQELSPALRNRAARASYDSDRDSSTRSRLSMQKNNDQRDSLSELPSNLKTQGQNVAKEIARSLGKDPGDIKDVYLNKTIRSTNAGEAKDFIVYFVTLKDFDSPAPEYSKKFEIEIFKDKVKENPDNPRLGPDVARKVLSFVKSLQKELV